MKYSSKQLIRSLLIGTSLATMFIACKRDSVLNNSTGIQSSLAGSSGALEANGNSPAAHIAASENLAIPAAVSVPDNLPNGNTRVATYYGLGVQKYKARIKAGSDPVAYEWVFVAPQADLYDITNTKVGTHGAGPFWTTSSSDSIFAQHFTPARTAPSEDPESIDWLLLKPKAGTTPTGIFAEVDYIQRIATKGGKAPLTPPASITDTADVKYKTVYRFTKMN
ncbi:MAG TPA: DUF3455 domain-containing protein [Chitinophagaceae bacterium]|nr:DUF3455 domain-containing protein [Chitinophagaceae bacterium]